MCEKDEEIKRLTLALAERDALLRDASHLAKRLHQSSLGMRRQALAELLAFLADAPDSAEPSAPVERDERAELRSHLGRMIGQAEYMLELAENSFDGDIDDDDGSFDECREYIEQARAALDCKP